ncbi:MAG: DUF2779 domain-containing protein [Leptospira sp.]|nr:DUF2779 domain-containing protein [Leptospira sp.]
MNPRDLSFNYITKSKILQFTRCTNLFEYNLTHKKPKSTEYVDSIYGLDNRKIKEMARSLFPGGVNITNKDDIYISHQNSMDAIRNSSIIYNPTFLWEDCIGSPDILVPSEDGTYVLWEICPSINTKKDMELEIAYYKYILNHLDIKISFIKVLKIDPQYTLVGEFELASYFTELNFETKVNSKMKELEEILTSLRAIKSDPQFQYTPKICNSFKSCTIPEYCFSDLKDGNIFSLREAAGTAKELYEQGIYHLRDIPSETELTDKQTIQIETEKTNLPHINTKKIKQFLDRIQYPVYYLDFETINPQIPIYQNSKPYQHIPFLFSLHILETKEDTEPKHFDYIQEDGEDPRKIILEKLSSLIDNKGTILCFNDFFEKRCISESVQVYPEYKDWFESIRPNFLDSAIPFKNLDYYNPSQKGSASLKDILPALTESSHSHLDIQNGYSANLEFLKVIKNSSYYSDEAKTTFGQLREYCKMDSYALFLIQKELERIMETRSSQ